MDYENLPFIIKGKYKRFRLQGHIFQVTKEAWNKTTYSHLASCDKNTRGN